MAHLKEKQLDKASRYLFLTMAITVIKQDRRHIANGAHKIKEPYLELLGKMEVCAREERKHLRSFMDTHQVYVIETSRHEAFTTFSFMAAGYEEKRNYFNPAIRRKVEFILWELMEKALKQKNVSP
ncbi:hypothetical protein AAV35_009370 [Salimicrobium jeotgali]|uniref:YhjD n=1 Tax=Salimicrobium jeotgali TaxID=1230341 RepID=K2G9F3_9BACI|nr:hypothetical protein [Salimicrobium jeotgali]AKG04990.1 hypothetical protein AAV35_009370 [Salimicrobium jeotgali]EKE31673.1 hypothetical protein MJ3_07828 [Salimicrobium jeotgali]MBM7696495.1 hypothetical protein [Salimicrobium jeotgali]